MEVGADVVHAKAREGRLPQTCFHETRGRGGGLKRTKFFFGARCGLHLIMRISILWTRQSMTRLACVGQL